ncbi:Glutamyl-tRNA(Gln) amidotransferase subunit A [Cytospora mali]|uniref:Glutamyl-tRNA(Gln) amidotransferase subunit A n=1 Tax=Cytospora mali TaxID=578113 RepID=A0A194WAV4_CYTMA|nr:Glutamyl-tRNA(Gln) amidotransferase subunit A [Valsa mali]
MRSSKAIPFSSLRMLLTSILCLVPMVAALNDAYDIREATTDSIHNALFTGLATCRDIVSSYLARIEALNPTINSLTALNPEALSIADGMDLQVIQRNATGPLFCIPVLLKDNFDAVPMNTTGSCLALAGNKPTDDSPTVRALKDAGAIILGKTNMHELALEGLTVSSLGGQTLNPYDQTRTPGGSSGGSGAAVAANFAVLATGTDTMNSLRSPAASNSLFSFRPTRGLISRAGVIPISYTQDAVGAMARTVRDLAVALTVMAGVGNDPRDNATGLVPPGVIGTDYVAALRGGQGLSGLRLGLVKGFFDPTDSEETTPVNKIMATIVDKLQSDGATVVDITDAIYNTTAISAALDVQAYEYREGLDGYLASPSLSGDRPANFEQLYTSGKFLVIPNQYSFINESLISSTSNESYFTAQRGIQNLTSALHTTFLANKLDALIYPEQKHLVVKVGSSSQSGRNGILAAVTGSPVVVIPAGFSEPSEDAPKGVPVGMEILGMPWSEGKLLNIAQGISNILPVRKMPSFANSTVEVPAGGYEGVPVLTVTPLANIPPAYPVGRLYS